MDKVDLDRNAQKAETFCILIQQLSLGSPHTGTEYHHIYKKKFSSGQPFGNKLSQSAIVDNLMG